MTYCIGMKLEDGLVLLSDTRTNAGIDNISRFRKMFTWEVPGELALVLVTAGNLSITQSVIARLRKAIADSEQGANIETILNADGMFRVAQLVGENMRCVQEVHRHSVEAQGATADAAMLLAGQRRGGEHRLFLIYAAGNFIEASADSPYLQLGEHKYGKPILDRVITPSTPIPTALKAAFVSMDSTLRSNLSVGMPLDLAVIETDKCRLTTQRRIEQDDADFQQISTMWADALRVAFHALPDISRIDDEH